MWSFGSLSKRSRGLIAILAAGLLAGIVFDRTVLSSPDFEQIYRIVLARVVSTAPDELTSVALARFNDGRIFFEPLPPRLSQRLLRDWTHKVRFFTDLIIPTDRILPVYGKIERFGTQMNRFEEYLDVKTRKGVRVFVIDSIQWLGTDEVLVSWSSVRAGLDARGSTLRLKRVLGFWRIVEENHTWIS